MRQRERESGRHRVGGGGGDVLRIGSRQRQSDRERHEEHGGRRELPRRGDDKRGTGPIDVRRRGVSGSDRASRQPGEGEGIDPEELHGPPGPSPQRRAAAFLLPPVVVRLRRRRRRRGRNQQGRRIRRRHCVDRRTRRRIGAAVRRRSRHGGDRTFSRPSLPGGPSGIGLSHFPRIVPRHPPVVVPPLDRTSVVRSVRFVVVVFGRRGRGEARVGATQLRPVGSRVRLLERGREGGDRRYRRYDPPHTQRRFVRGGRGGRIGRRGRSRGRGFQFQRSGFDLHTPGDVPVGDRGRCGRWGSPAAGEAEEARARRGGGRYERLRPGGEVRHGIRPFRWSRQEEEGFLQEKGRRRRRHGDGRERRRRGQKRR
mmetsp:Transcript_40766/g.122805  ORF Transcript_40766/g.122805 Transcript_40766/m.122805 type:complete len:369 (-) Transcript_40766:1240-2346(-)